jgi:hypothetical protein
MQLKQRSVRLSEASRIGNNSNYLMQAPVDPGLSTAACGGVVLCAGDHSQGWANPR